MRTFVVVFTLACSCHAAPPAHSKPFEIVVGEQPIDVETGDFDGDGKLDVVTANGKAASLSVRLRRPPGWKGFELAAQPSTHLVRAADVDGDRDLDLVATSHDTGTVQVWLGDGKGGFAHPVRTVAVDVPKPHNHGLVVGDLDGNGTADVVVADQTGHTVVALLADRQGRLVAGKPVVLPGQAYPPALGDLDGDGKLDLVVPLISARAVAILRGDGAGGFAAVAAPHRTARERPYGIAIGDIDGDRDGDVIVTHDDTNDISVLLGDGKGALRNAPRSPITAGRRLGVPQLIDVDGDGILDLIGAGSGALVIMRGDGHGTFGEPSAVPSDGYRAAAADLDGDGKIDVLAPEPKANGVRVWPTSR